MTIPKFETNEEIIRFVTQKMKEQGTMSVAPDSGDCKYRGPNGNKCALGHLIPDEDYHPDMESYSPSGHLYTPKAEKLNKYVNENLVIDGDTIPVLRQLQHCHDGAIGDNFFEEFMGNMKENSRLSGRYGDTISSLYQEMV